MWIFHWLSFCFLVVLLFCNLGKQGKIVAWTWDISLLSVILPNKHNVCLMIETLLSYWADWRSSDLLRQPFRPGEDFSVWGSIFHLGFSEGLRDRLAVSAVALMKVSHVHNITRNSVSSGHHSEEPHWMVSELMVITIRVISINFWHCILVM